MDKNEMLAELQEIRAEVVVLRENNELLTHKVITCGVAASHPDAGLTLRDDYKKWDSPQAEAVRKLRAEADSLRKDAQRWNWLMNDYFGGNVARANRVIGACFSREAMEREIDADIGAKT